MRLIFAAISILLTLYSALGQCPPAGGGGFSGNFTISSGTNCSVSNDLTLNKNDLTLDTNSSLTIDGNFTNDKNGTITVRSGAVLTVKGNFTSDMNGDFIVETGGIVIIEENFSFTKPNGGSNVQIAGGASVGGTASFKNSTKEVVIADGGVLEAETIDTDSDLDVQDGGTINSTSGNITGTGTVDTNSNTDGDCTNGCCGSNCNTSGDDLNGTGSEVLPVTLIDFEARKVSNGIEIYWSTASEENTSHFELYRSVDGKNFIEIASITAEGFADERNDYSFTDQAPASGRNFYRLTSVDFDGYTETFQVIHAEFDKTSLSVYPNPLIGDRLNISGMDTVGPSEIIIVDVMGRKVYNGSAYSEETYTINLENPLEKGIYFLKIRSIEGAYEHTSRLIVR